MAPRDEKKACLVLWIDAAAEEAENHGWTD
jgi:hypothetical protein